MRGDISKSMKVMSCAIVIIVGYDRRRLGLQPALYISVSVCLIVLLWGMIEED